MTRSASTPANSAVACVGLGVVGCSWAVAFLAAGHHVRGFDCQSSALKSARTAIRDGLELLERAGRIKSAKEAIGRLSLSDELEAAVSGCAYVQESVLEILDVKRELFERLESHDEGSTLYGSSTSSIAGSSFLTGRGISSRSIVVHPVNPPFAVSLVELCRTPETSDETYARVRQLMQSIGQDPVLIKREILGYVLNRLQAAVVGEALHLVTSGVIDASDLDKVVSAGLAPRWSIGGPFLTGHLNARGGYREYMTKYGHVFREIIQDLDSSHSWTSDDILEIDQNVRSSHGDSPQELMSAERDLALLRLRSFLENDVHKERSTG